MPDQMTAEKRWLKWHNSCDSASYEHPHTSGHDRPPPCENCGIAAIREAEQAVHEADGPWMQHKPGCLIRQAGVPPVCDCGLNEHRRRFAERNAMPDMTPEQRDDKWVGICGCKHKCSIAAERVVCRFCRVDMLREAEEAAKRAVVEELLETLQAYSPQVAADVRVLWAERGRDEPA